MRRAQWIVGLILSVLFFGIGTSVSQIKIMPLGDSITEGVKGSNPVGGFRDDLDSLLTDAGINFDFVGGLQNGVGFDADHEGHPGWRADQIDANINTWLNTYQPDMVLLHIGTNDVSNGDQNDQTIIEIESIIDKINNYNSNTPILFCSLIPRNDDKEAKNDNLNVLIENLFNKKREALYHIYYVGQNEVFKSHRNWALDYLSDTVHPNNTGYAVMAKVYFNAILNVLNGTIPYVTDNFNQRTELGETWSAEATFTIANNQLTNTNPNGSQMSDWDLAIYKGRRNPSEVRFVWGTDANQAGIQEGGFALKLDRTAPIDSVYGYLLWIGIGNNINLWTISNGVPNEGVTGASVPSLVPFPQAGDTVRVKMMTNSDGHHFSVFINGDSAGTVTDPDKLRGTTITQYAGVMLKGGTSLNNDIDDFELIKIGDTTAPAAITDLAVSNVSASSVSLTWTVPGDDDNAGTATSYDIRYSTSQINNNTDFNNAPRVSSPPTPLDPGLSQSFAITGLNQNTTYYFAMKTADEVPNWSGLSNVVNATTLQGLEFIDDFERTDLGVDWTAEPEFQIVNGELSNSSLEERWDFAALYNTRKNPIEVGFTYGIADSAADIENVAVILFESPSVDGNGYMAWYRPSKHGIFLWQVTNGSPFTPLSDLQNIGLPDPGAGDELSVGVSLDQDGRHFDYYINGNFYGRLTDPDTLFGKNSDLYVGVMMHGNRHNNIDNFRILNAPGSPSTLLKISGDMQSGTVNTDLPDPLVVRVTDENGNPISNVSVNYSITEGNGHVDLSPGDGNLRIEAESGQIVSPMSSFADGNASGGYYVATNQLQAGQETINFYISTPGNYYVWGRVYAQDGTHNSFWITMDSGQEITWDIGDDVNGTQSQWVWEKVKGRTEGVMVYNLGTGSHTLLVKARETFTRLDKVLITLDANYLPSGLEGAQGYVTDPNGETRAIFTLGTLAGQNKITVTAPILPGQEVVFTETGRADTPTQISEVSGNNQTGAGGQPLAAPFVVKVSDQYGNPVTGALVTFTVTVGTGTLADPQPVTTDATGQASTTLTLGTAGSQNEVRASSPGTTPAEIIFTATATSGVASDIEYLSGNNQSGTVGSQLPQPIAVKVTDALGQPMAGIDVNFVVTQGGGSIVESQPVQSGADGVAQAHWKLGTVAGVQKAEAQANGLTGSPILFTATGLADAAVTLTKVSGDSATGMVNHQLNDPFRVKVTDQYGNPVQGVGVLFTVIEGGGKFLNNQATQTVNTDSSGIAAAFLILGPVAGQFNNKVQVEKSGLAGSPITFVASAGAANAAKIVYVSGNNQIGFVRQELPQPFVVKVMDASDNVVAGHPVEFRVINGGGTLNGTTDTLVIINTDQNGLASATFWPGPVAGELVNEVHATSTNGAGPLTNSPIVFKASAKYIGVKIIMVSGDQQTGVVTSVLPQPLKVKILDANNQPVADEPVTFEVKSGGGSLDGSGNTTVVKTTDAQGIASVTLKLGSTVGQNNNVVHASATDGFDPLTGSPVEFKATAVASNAVKIVIAGGDDQTGVVGKALSSNVQVSVQDNQGNGVAGHPVTFRITKGNGHFSGGDTIKTVNSNANGIAEVQWYLGTRVGTNNNQVQAEASDGVNPLQNSPLTFTASATPDVTDPNASTVVATSPAIADGNSVSNVTVTLVDQYGNPLSGKVVTISVSGSHNFVSPGAVQTGVNGQAVFSLTSVTAERKTITATNTTDNISLNNSAVVEFISGPATRMIRLAGNEQTRNVGTVLKNPLVIQIQDNFNNPVSGTAVYFEVKDGKGGGYIIENQPVISDSNGEARVSYVLGNEAGSNLVEAKSGSLLGSPVLFSVNGEVNPATQMVKYSGDNQNGIAGQPLADPIVVQVFDQKGDPVKDVPVLFSVTLGGGQVSQPQPVSTDAFGRASIIFTLGPSVGVHIVRAESQGLQNSPLSFIANANSGAPQKLVLVSGNDQSGVVNTFGSPLQVRVLDANDNPVAGFPVHFTVISGDVTIHNPQPDTSDAGGFASATFKYGTRAGNALIRAEASGLAGSPIDFHLSALPDVANSISLAWGDNQRGTLEHELVYSLAVRIKDQWNNYVPGVSVTFVITQGNASIEGNSTVESNQNGIASCRILLGSTPGTITVLAIASGLNGSPVTFTITAVNNNFPTITADVKQATIEENKNIAFNVTGNDPDNDPLQFQVWNLPAGASFDSLNATTRRFVWTPDYSQSGNYQVRFAVLDGNGGIDRDTVLITVLNNNRKPIITLFDPQESTLTVKQGEGKQFRIQAEDPDNEPIEYFWTKNGQKVALGQSYNYSSDPSFIGTDVIVGHATDGIDTVSHQWTVTVKSSVELESFTINASAETAALELTWVTRRERDNHGFNLYRSMVREGNYVKINDPIILSNDSGVYTYMDQGVQPGLRYYYKLEAVSLSGSRTWYGPISAQLDLPRDFALEQNYPNPFNPETTIKFQLPKHVHVAIGIYNILGQKIRILVDKEMAPGYHRVKWNGRDDEGTPVTSGIYYYRIQAGSFTALKKMILLK